MTEFYSASSSVSPFTAVIWCFYPIALLIIIELQKQTNCPEEDLKDFLEFISKQWNK